MTTATLPAPAPTRSQPRPAVDPNAIHVPYGIVDLNAYRQWVHSASYPTEARIAFIKGVLWVDQNMEEARSHNQVKGEITGYFRVLNKAEKLGVFFPDGMLLTNDAAEVANEPDGMFVLNASFAEGKVRLATGERNPGGQTELIGSPDIVIEVVSPSSAVKDTSELMTAYWVAGISEYWLIDARAAAIRFVIYKRGRKGFTAVKPVGGWIKSAVLDRELQLTREETPTGLPDYTLASR